MMYNNDLKEGLVCYWENCGFHGCVVIRRFNSKYVYFSHISEETVEDKIYFKALSKFLSYHEIYKHLCAYGGFHKNIGKVIKMR